MSAQVGREADSMKEGMTLGEMVKFVQEALRLDLDMNTPLRGSIGWSGQIRKVSTGTRRV